MTLLETLIEGRRRIAEVGWTQLFLGRDAEGEGIRCWQWHEKGASATCYCASGAVDGDVLAVDRLERYTLISLANWNDRPGRKVEQVIALFDRAIADVRGREAAR